MPITLAHPLAVLPLRGRISALTGPLPALVAGSMVPDLPLFAGWGAGYQATHSALGVVTVDVVLTVLVVAVWVFVARDALVDLAPDWIRSRLPAQGGLTVRQWLLVPVAGVIGAATHVVWDSFTHVETLDTWGPRHLAWLRTEHAGLLGVKWAQYLSGVIGMAVLGVVIIGSLRSREPLTEPRQPRALPAVVLPVVVVGVALVGVMTVASRLSQSLRNLAFYGVVNTIIAAGCAGLMLCMAWQVARRATRRDSLGS